MTFATSATADPVGGELIQNQIRIGLSRMERVVKERMTTQDVEAITPQTLINILRSSPRSRSSSGPRSCLSSWTNQHAGGLTHKRRLSALGPGAACRGSARGSSPRLHPVALPAGLCPIETPEGRTSA